MRRTSGSDKHSPVLAALLIVAGWTLTAALLSWLDRFVPVGTPSPALWWQTFDELFEGAARALAIGLALRGTNPAMTWRQVAALVIGWVLSAPLHIHLTPQLILLRLTVLIGGLVASLILILIIRRVHPAIAWWRLWFIFGVWGVSCGLLTGCHEMAANCWQAPFWITPRLFDYTFAGLPMPRVMIALICSVADSVIMFWQLGQAGWGAENLTSAHRADLRTGIRVLFNRRRMLNPVARWLATGRPLVPPSPTARMRRSIGRLVLMALLSIPFATLCLSLFRASQASFIVYVPFAARSVTVAFFPLALLVCSPLLVAGTAAALTGRDARTRQFDLLRLTSLSEMDIVWGYVSATLARLDDVLFFSTVAVPGLLALLCGCSLFMAVSLTIPADLPVWAIALAGLIVGLVGANLLGAAVGVTLGLWWRHAGAMAVAPLATLAMITAGILGLLVVSNDRLGAVCASLLFMAAPYLLAVEMVDDARRWVERMPHRA